MPTRHRLALAIALAAAPVANAQTRGFQWEAGSAPTPPMLRFAVPDGGPEALRLSCATDGTRVVVIARGTPRGLAGDAREFPTRVNLFLGRTEYSLGGVGTRLADGNSQVEALLPDVNGFFAALARQGRLVAVTFAGRTKAPAPAADLVAGFRAACDALR